MTAKEELRSTPHPALSLPSPGGRGFSTPSTSLHNVQTPGPLPEGEGIPVEDRPERGDEAEVVARFGDVDETLH